MSHKKAAPLFTLSSQMNWPYLMLRCNDQELSVDAAHEVVFAAMKVSEDQDIVVHVDELFHDGELYIVLTMDDSTASTNEKECDAARAKALGVIMTIVSETRKYIDLREEAMASHPAGSARR